jgi:hypothetical protein
VLTTALADSGKKRNILNPRIPKRRQVLSRGRLVPCIMNAKTQQSECQPCAIFRSIGANVDSIGGSRDVQ